MVLDENPRNGSMEDVKVVAGGDDGGKASLSAGGLVPSDAAAERLPNKRRIIRLCGIEWTVYPKRIPQTCARSQESVDWDKERRISIDSERLFPSPRFLKKNEMSANNRNAKRGRVAATVVVGPIWLLGSYISVVEFVVAE
jgi:hypothetical protein